MAHRDTRLDADTGEMIEQMAANEAVPSHDKDRFCFHIDDDSPN